MTISENMLEKRLIHGKQILHFKNREAYLAGIYPDIQTLDGAQGDQSSPTNADFKPRMELLARHSNNFFRHWVIFYPNFAKPANLKPYPNCSEAQPSVTSGGVPWRQRYSPFSFANGKWDLSSFNPEYFQRLRTMIQTAQGYGMIVQLTIFDRAGTDDLKDCLRWPSNPWNSRNNINGLIQDAHSGVNKFYDRGQTGVLSDGTATTLGFLQDRYVDMLVSETMRFPNVVYEIMNEPIHNPAATTSEGLLAESKARARWADAIVRVIWSQTQGRRFIFYNDHTFARQNEHARGQDIINWKALSTDPNSGVKNYSHLDGVIFHGDAKMFNPDNLDPSIRHDLIIQVSTDTNTESSANETKQYNLDTTRHAFVNYMMFQAEATSEEAADGIGSAMPLPTLFNLPPFVGKWFKLANQSTPDGFPHIMHVQNADGSVVDLNQDTDGIPMRGRAFQVDSEKIFFWNELSQKVGKFFFQFLSQSLLKLTRDSDIQVFQRYDEGDSLWPFLFEWERTSVTPPDSPIQPFYMFFYPDKSLITRRKLDFTVNNRQRVTRITPPLIFIHSDTFNNDSVWKYAFSPDGQQLTMDRRDPANPASQSNPPLTQAFLRVV